MNVIKRFQRLACWVAAWAALVGQANFSAAETVLIDFGNDTSYRGLSANSPDTNGNYWNSVQPGLLVTNLIDITNTGTTVALGWDTPVATDSYNGPAGATNALTLETDVLFTAIDAAALGRLGGSLEAAFDFASGYDGVSHFPVRFQLQGLNPAASYNLTFFGSHSFSDDATTVYTVYTDSTYATPVATTNLLVADPFFTPNSDRVATITGVSPQADDILYIEFVGLTGKGGYLNSLQLEATAPVLAADFNHNGVVDGNDLAIWKDEFGDVGPSITADANGDGVVDGNDFLVWQRERTVPAPVSPATAAVPEPAGLMLLLIGAAAAMGVRRRAGQSK